MMTGRNKVTLAREHGAEQVMAWRRKYDAPPPSIDEANALQRTIETDIRYDLLPGGVPRRAFSHLHAMAAGLLACYCADHVHVHVHICDPVCPMFVCTAPRAWRWSASESGLFGSRASHLRCGRGGQSWSLHTATHCAPSSSWSTKYQTSPSITSTCRQPRRCCMRSETLHPATHPQDAVSHTPTLACERLQFDADLNHLHHHGLWGDKSGVVRHGRYLVDEARVRAAQEAMRQQVNENIAYSTFRPETDEVVEAAFTAESAGSEIAEIE